MEFMFVIFVWNATGFIITSLIDFVFLDTYCHNGSEFFIPLWWYNTFPLNWFGVTVCCLGMNLLCPIWSGAFWFKKLCTVGRED